MGNKMFICGYVAGVVAIQPIEPSVIYTPAHTKDDQSIPQKAVFKVCCDRKTIGDGKKKLIPGETIATITATGKLADACLRSCTPHREIDVLCTDNGELLNIVFGPENDRYTFLEVIHGYRPPGWDGSLPQTKWREIWEIYTKRRNIAPIDDIRETLSYAKINDVQERR